MEDEQQPEPRKKKEINPFFWVRFNLGCQSSTSFPETSDPAHRRGPSDCAPYLVFFVCGRSCCWKRKRKKLKSKVEVEFFFSAARSTTSKLFSKTTKKGPRIVVHVIISRHSDVPSHRALPDSLRSCERGKDAEKERGLFK